MNATESAEDAQNAEFGAVAAWSAQALLGRDRTSMVAGACRGSGSPAALAWLAESLKLAPDMTLLDVGAGLGGASSWAAEHYAVRPLAVDSMVDASLGAARLFDHPAVTASATAIPLRDAAVSVAWSLGVLDTLPDPLRALTEMRRVLTAEGRLGLLAYVAEQPIDRSSSPEGNRFRPLHELVETLTAARFVVVDVLPGGRIPDAPVDWQLCQQRLQSDLERLHGDDPRWTTARVQEERFAHLLASSSVSVALVHAMCV